jgi:putative molybdopterin biosynthesis protein
MGKTDRRDLSSPSALRKALDRVGMEAGTETVSVDRSAGRVLAERVDARIDVPGFDRAAMDGYAVRATDTDGAGADGPVRCDLVGRIRAGERPELRVDAGEAAEITTGAVVPPGADAVVIVERTEERDGGVSIHDSVAPGENISVAGADVAAGSRALGPGTTLSPREVGLLAALGRGEVEVRARPAVGIVPTGAELVDPGGEIDHGSGQIYDTNTHTIAAGVREAGGDPTVYSRVGDDVDAIRSTLERAAGECDLVLSSGSTSAGAGDVIRRVIEEHGDLLVHGVAVKPGKPTLVGRLEGAGYVGLPGYPVSALSVFRVFVAPAIREAAGLPDPASGTVDARMARAERFTEKRHRYVPVGLVTTGTGETLAYPVDKGSGATTSLAYADGVVEMAADRETIDAGTTVSVDRLSPERDPPPLLGIGEDGPVVSRLLDRVEGSRYLSRGTRPGLRLFRDGVPDVTVVSGPTGATAAADTGDGAVELGGWSREWGLVVPAGNPGGIEGLGDLLDRDLLFANRVEDSGLRASLGSALAGLAAERGIDRHDLIEAIEGFDRGFPGVESPARRVTAGRADAGVGLRSTAERLDLGFVRIGTERLRVFSREDRAGKAGVIALTDALESIDAVVEAVPGAEAE